MVLGGRLLSCKAWGNDVSEARSMRRGVAEGILRPTRAPGHLGIITCPPRAWPRVASLAYAAMAIGEGKGEVDGLAIGGVASKRVAPLPPSCIGAPRSAHARRVAAHDDRGPPRPGNRFTSTFPRARAGARPQAKAPVAPSSPAANPSGSSSRPAAQGVVRIVTRRRRDHVAAKQVTARAVMAPRVEPERYIIVNMSIP